MSEEAKSASEKDKTVIVYSTPLCAPCEALKSYLREHGIAFTATDLMMDEAAADKMAALNIRSSPVLEVDGEILAGRTLTQEKVNALLGIG